MLGKCGWRARRGSVITEDLRKAEAFIADELETRRCSYLPTDNSEDAEYIKSAEEALAAVRRAMEG
jgi:hypothetical protein